VLCQVKFSPVLRLREEGAADEFQERIRRIYPRYSRTAGVGFVISPQGVQVQESGPPLHRFHGANGFSATLGTDFVALETESYGDFDEFAERVANLAIVVAELFEPPEMPRTGLRFINELRLSSQTALADARAIINPSLLGPLAEPLLDGALGSSEQVLNLVSTSGTMIVRHGLRLEGGTTVVPSGPPTPETSHDPDLVRPFYLLDLDSFDETTVSFDPDVARERVLAFNDDNRSFFAWAVAERYRREELGQEDMA
jgi:uncharacterized protein (TIGR04255 family)